MRVPLSRCQAVIETGALPHVVSFLFHSRGQELQLAKTAASLIYQAHLPSPSPLTFLRPPYLLFARVFRCSCSFAIARAKVSRLLPPQLQKRGRRPQKRFLQAMSRPRLPKRARKRSQRKILVRLPPRLPLLFPPATSAKASPAPLSPLLLPPFPSITPRPSPAPSFPHTFPLLSFHCFEFLSLSLSPVSAFLCMARSSALLNDILSHLPCPLSPPTPLPFALFSLLFLSPLSAPSPSFPPFTASCLAEEVDVPRSAAELLAANHKAVLLRARHRVLEQLLSLVHGQASAHPSLSSRKLTISLTHTHTLARSHAHKLTLRLSRSLAYSLD